MSDDQDPLVLRAIDELRRLPSVERSAVERVVSAAAAARVAPSDDDIVIAPPRGRGARWWVTGAIAAGAVVVGFVLNESVRPASRDVAQAPPASLQKGVVYANTSPAEREAMPVLQQFVFNDRSAHRVSVVGDFNEWAPTASPMTRSSDGDMWSVTVPILPGRHTFGFMVDDSIFVLDPRFPKVRDPDLGTEESVVIVGRP
ncbi:MAG TPA: hypothetical protein VN706_08935 [Gemmatimonadaceae bacterium]|nr:hypothetical protein [Gemmatimonadaceae bacterium]